MIVNNNAYTGVHTGNQSCHFYKADYLTGNRSRSRFTSFTSTWGGAWPKTSAIWAFQSKSRASSRFLIVKPTSVLPSIFRRRLKNRVSGSSARVASNQKSANLPLMRASQWPPRERTNRLLLIVKLSASGISVTRIHRLLPSRSLSRFSRPCPRIKWLHALATIPLCKASGIKRIGFVRVVNTRNLFMMFDRNQNVLYQGEYSRDTMPKISTDHIDKRQSNPG